MGAFLDTEIPGEKLTLLILKNADSLTERNSNALYSVQSLIKLFKVSIWLKSSFNFTLFLSTINVVS